MVQNQNYDRIAGSTITAYNDTRPQDRRDKICHAPSKSLLFTPSGNAMACHYNRGLVLGSYPQDSIRDIWFGEKIERLRKFIDNNDLSYGCQSCKSALNAEQYHTAGCWRHDYLETSENGYPVLLDLQIDNTCNLECVMCSGEYSSLIRKNREQKPAYLNPYDDEFVKQLEEFIPHLSGINFTGGEPFLIGIYYDIMDRIIELNPKIQIYIHSNGTVLNKKVKKYLHKLNFNFTISIDSIVRETYENIRVNARLETVLKNIQYFHEYSSSKETSFHVKSCIMKSNIAEIPDYLSFFNDQNISIQLKPVLMPTDYSLRDLEIPELKKIIDNLRTHSFKKETHFQRLNNSRYTELTMQLEKWANDKQDFGKRNHSVAGLVQALFDRIDHEIEIDHTLNFEEKEAKSIRCRTIGKQMIQSIPDTDKRERALSRFANLPTEFIIAEMERGNIEMLNARFLQEA